MGSQKKSGANVKRREYSCASAIRKSSYLEGSGIGVLRQIREVGGQNREGRGEISKWGVCGEKSNKACRGERICEGIDASFRAGKKKKLGGSDEAG